MTPRLRDLPRLVVLMATAFAEREARPAVVWLRLVRSLSLSVAHRWGAARLLADPDGACLLWSDLSPRRRLLPGLRGAALALLVCLAWAALCAVAVAPPLLLLLARAGVGSSLRLGVALAVLLGPPLLSALGALRDARLEARRAALLPDSPGGCWRVDVLAALPAGRGAGGRLLDAFVRQADAAGVRVVLLTDGTLRDFYRRHGFRAQPDDPALDGLLQMVRTPPVRRRRAPAAPAA